ncbi:MAG: FAD-dependent oxidoreductase [Pyrinomonadaceae bacterium]
MKQNTQKPVVVIGAGLAGLTAANYFRQQGVPVRLFEAGKQIAGLAQSFHDDEGFTYDFGAHFITNRLARAVGIESLCRDVPRYRETVWLDNKHYGYPFGLLRVPRYAASGMASRLHAFGKVEAESATDWFRQQYGKRLADEVALPLIEAWSGASSDDLAHTVGSSIPSSILRIIWLKLASRVTGHAIACGYSREQPENTGVWHVYPEGGIGTLCQKLANDLAGSIELESPVQEIVVENERATGVRVNGEFQAASAVVSTAPVNILAKLMRGTDKLKYLARFRYRPMVFVNLRMNGRHLLPDVVTWTPEDKFPFFRLTETPLSMPWLAPAGKTIITVDIGCQVGDEIWSMDDAALAEYCVSHLAPIIPDARERYLGSRVLRTPIAYPIFAREYEEDRLRFQAGTGIEGLHSVGRNGEFMHIFMEDVYTRTLVKMHGLKASLAPGGFPDQRGRNDRGVRSHYEQLVHAGA